MTRQRIEAKKGRALAIAVPNIRNAVAGELSLMPKLALMLVAVAVFVNGFVRLGAGILSI